MTRIMKLAAWTAAMVGIVLAALYGPVLAAFLFVGAAFALIAGLMLRQALHAIGDWRLDHPWKVHLPWTGRA